MMPPLTQDPIPCPSHCLFSWLLENGHENGRRWKRISFVTAREKSTAV